MTHTYALMHVSRATYDEIAGKLQAAGYTHAPKPGQDLEIDMHGIALAAEPEKTGECFLCRRTLPKSRLCMFDAGNDICDDCRATERSLCGRTKFAPYRMPGTICTRELGHPGQCVLRNG